MFDLKIKKIVTYLITYAIFIGNFIKHHNINKKYTQKISNIIHCNILNTLYSRYLICSKITHIIIDNY